jgi:hypothetical protein
MDDSLKPKDATTNPPLLIYIAGPYSPTPAQRHLGGATGANISAARDVAIQVWSKGHYALTPHLNTAYFDIVAPSVPHQQYLDGDLRMLAGCDAILMIRDWEGSKGARGERVYAIINGIPVYYELDTLLDDWSVGVLKPRQLIEARTVIAGDLHPGDMQQAPVNMTDKKTTVEAPPFPSQAARGFGEAVASGDESRICQWIIENAARLGFKFASEVGAAPAPAPAAKPAGGGIDEAIERAKLEREIMASGTDAVAIDGMTYTAEHFARTFPIENVRKMAEALNPKPRGVLPDGFPFLDWMSGKDTPEPAPAAKPEESVLQEAERLIHGDRHADYGHPLDDFTAQAEMFTAYLRKGGKLAEDETLDYMDVAMLMILVKVARQAGMRKRDNLVDTAGYAGCAEDAEKEDRRRAIAAWGNDDEGDDD